MFPAEDGVLLSEPPRPASLDGIGLILEHADILGLTVKVRVAEVTCEGVRTAQGLVRPGPLPATGQVHITVFMGCTTISHELTPAVSDALYVHAKSSDTLV